MKNILNLFVVFVAWGLLLKGASWVTEPLWESKLGISILGYLMRLPFLKKVKFAKIFLLFMVLFFLGIFLRMFYY